MTRITSVLFLVLALVGCTRRCRDGTILLNVDFSAIGNVDELDVDSASFHAAPKAISGNPRTGTVELDFPSGSYPKGQTLTLVLTARSAGQIVGVATIDVTLTDSCATPPTILFGTQDLGTNRNVDMRMTSYDLNGVDLSGMPTCVIGTSNVGECVLGQ